MVGLLKRASRAYKLGQKQSSFIPDLMTLKVPNLLFVSENIEHHVYTEFIELIQSFVQDSDLQHIIIEQAVTIVVRVYFLYDCSIQ